MPQINLLAPTIGKKSQRLRASILPGIDFSVLSRSMVPSLVPLAAILLIISIATSLIVGQKKRALAGLNKRIAALAISPAELLKIQTHQAALESKIATLDDLSTRKFFWADKLNDIGACVPKGVWLNELVLSNNRVFYETVSGQKEYSDQVFLTIRGSAIAPQIDNAVSFIGEFVDTLKQKTSFSQDFSDIKLNAIYKGSIGKSDVMNFELMCVLK